MEWIKGYPTEEGFYLTTSKYRYEDKYTTPKVLEFKFKRYRTGELYIVDGEKVGVWINNHLEVSSDYYHMELPKYPTHIIINNGIDIK